MPDQIPPSLAPPTTRNERKAPWSFTHGQFFGSLGSISLVLALSQYRVVKDIFWTREEGKATNAVVTDFKSTTASLIASITAAQIKQADDFRAQQATQIAEIKTLIIAQDTEHTHRLERLSDKISDKIKDSEARSVDRLNWVKKEVDGLHSELETFAFKMDSNPRKKTTN